MKKIICSLFFLTPAFALCQEHKNEKMHSTSTAEYESQWQITPSLSILNIPHPLSLGLEAVYSNSIGLKIQKSLEPSMTMDENKLKLDDKNIQIRKYLSKSMFLGFGYGEHRVDATHSESYNGINANIFAKVKSEYLTPTVGWKWMFSNRLTLGLELGWIFPFNSSASVGSDQESNPIVGADPDYRKAVQDAEDSARKLVSSGIPNIGLLEVGWTF